MPPYKKLLTYWFTVIIYDRTVEFCKLFLLSHLGNLSNLGGAPDRRTSDQMIQAARSGKQNIVEGSQAMATSIKSAIKLTGVANASLEELIEDLEDFLRQRNLKQWPKDDPRILSLRRQSAALVSNLSILRDLSTLGGQLKLPQDPESAANFILTLCHQATFLLSKQVAALFAKHEHEGSLTEKLYTSRLKYLKNLK